MNDSVILLGTLNGLIKYDTGRNTFQPVDKIPQLPTNPIVRLDKKSLPYCQLSRAVPL